MADSTHPLEALLAAIDAIGSQAALSRLLDVAQPTVWGWVHKMKRLPAEHVLVVETATGISRHALRPDIYPIESPGAPADAPADNPDSGMRLADAPAGAASSRAAA